MKSPQNKEVITKKEIYERLIILETKMDLKYQLDGKTTHQFRWFVVLLVLIESINFIISYLLYRKI